MSSTMLVSYGNSGGMQPKRARGKHNGSGVQVIENEGPQTSMRRNQMFARDGRQYAKLFRSLDHTQKDL